tara:strand:+ start:223 stop:387 length:165 start_codon:yes stop_codon:yes gene_type:complete
MDWAAVDWASMAVVDSVDSVDWAAAAMADTMETAVLLDTLVETKVLENWYMCLQ